ncbi:MAG TPA: hypothetical protein DCY07_02805 [Rhodospirillaceae bacterium]|nr:hypothetical protein [Rhodospirillaceae bacterium]
MKRLHLLPLLLALLTPLPETVRGEESQVATATGLPLPRFASLYTDEVNLRTGPGTRYPIEWVYVRQGLPVEITAEFEIWRRIRDWEGSEGWVHKSALTGKRSAIIGNGKKTIYASDSATAEILATVEPNAIGQLLACQANWCEVKFQDIKGYMPKADFWGAYAQEIFD